MSNWLVAFGVPAGLLLFYPLVLVFAQLPIFRKKPQLLKRLHLGGWGLTLLLVVGFVTGGISLRGQWLDALPFGLAWVAAGTYFWRCHRQLASRAKFYFGAWFCYPACLALAYLADKVFFVLVSAPLLAFLPSTTYYSSSTVLLRAPVSGFLSAKRVQLITPIGFVLEKHMGFTADNLLTAAEDSITNVQLKSSWRPDSVEALITTRQGQHVVKFSR
jgi:hypothetical protein